MPATTHAYQDNSDVGLRWPPSGTAATTAGPALAPPPPRDMRGRPSRSARSGGWQRQRCRSSCRLGSPWQPGPTPGRQPGDLRRPRGPPPLPRLQTLPSRPRRGPQAHRGLRPQPQQAAPRPQPRPPACRQGRGVAPARAPGASSAAAAAAEEGGEGAQGAETTAPASRATAPAGHAAAPSTPRARGMDPARAPSTGGQGGRQVPLPGRPQPHPHQPPQGRLPYGTDAARPHPGTRGYAARCHAAAATAARGRPARDPGGGGQRARGAGCRPRERGAGYVRRKAECPRTNAGGRPGRTRQGVRAKARARYRGQRQRRGTERGQRTARRGTREPGKGKGTGRTHRGASRA